MGNKINKMKNTKMTIKNLFVALALVSGVAFFINAQAQQIDWAQLNLNPKQAYKIQALEQEWRNSYRQTHPDLSAKRSQLRALMSSPDANPQQVMTLQRDIDKHERFLRQQATRIFMEKKKALTVNQRKALHDMMHPVAASR